MFFVSVRCETTPTDDACKQSSKGVPFPCSLDVERKRLGMSPTVLRTYCCQRDSPCSFLLTAKKMAPLSSYPYTKIAPMTLFASPQKRSVQQLGLCSSSRIACNRRKQKTKLDPKLPRSPATAIGLSHQERADKKGKQRTSKRHGTCTHQLAAPPNSGVEHSESTECHANRLSEDICGQRDCHLRCVEPVLVTTICCNAKGSHAEDTRQPEHDSANG